MQNRHENFFSAEVYWDSLAAPPRITSDMFDNGKLKLHIHRNQVYQFDSKAFHYDADSKIICSVLGYISNIDDIKGEYSLSIENDADLIGYLYKIFGTNITKILDGVFLVFIFDDKKNEGYLFQAQFGFGLPVYYYSGKNGFFFSSSLKFLLCNSKQKRYFNDVAARDFLFYEKAIPNEKTLIKGISKLIPNRLIKIVPKEKNLEYIRTKHGNKKSTLNFAKANLLKTIEQQTADIYTLLRKESRIGTTLTAGWDTNLILHYLRKLTDKSIDAYIIEGGKSESEVDNVKNILTHYLRISLHTGHVKNNVVAALPNIVWIYEGYIFETGMFLRYELALLIKGMNHKHVYLGTGADQLIKSKTFNSLVKHIKLIFANNETRMRRSFGSLSSRAQFDVSMDYLIKMHDLVLNNFRIQGIYPFLNSQTARTANALGILNAKKYYYKKEIRTTINKNIVKYIKKSGAVVNTPTLFNAYKETLLKIFKKEFVTKILSNKQIARLSKNPDYYPNIIFHIVYLFLFNEIFISGKHDASFRKEALELTLDDFL